MPHSSGGGSHSSGSHGGSHSSHGGSRGSGNYRRVSSSYFAGATKYYYYQNHRPVYIYSNSDPSKTKYVERPFLILFYLPFIFAVYTMFGQALHLPTKLSTDYNTEIVIDDEADIMTDREERDLYDSLEDFYKETGVTPAIVTTTPGKWEDFESLEKYAYKEYVVRFEDEKHWLIVYSAGNDWKWEGMQGDETDDIITEGIADDFNRDLTDNFYRQDTLGVAGALQKSFDNLTPTIMEFSFDAPMFFMALFVTAFITFHAYFMLGVHPNAKKYQNVRAVPANSREDTCEYCGGVYIVGASLNCPHCGAAVKAHNDPYTGGMQNDPYGNNMYGNTMQSDPYGNNMYGNTAQNDPYGTNMYGNATQSNPYGNSMYGNTAQNNPYGTNMYGNATQSDPYGNNMYGNTAQNDPYGTNMYGNTTQNNPYGDNEYYQNLYDNSNVGTTNYNQNSQGDFKL